MYCSISFAWRGCNKLIGPYAVGCISLDGIFSELLRLGVKVTWLTMQL